MASIKAKIRKIVIGNNPKEDGLAFQIGNKGGHNGHLISDIIEDAGYFFIFGSVRFLVFIKKPGEDASYLWKSFQGAPTTIEYFLPTDDYEVLV